MGDYVIKGRLDMSQHDAALKQSISEVKKFDQSIKDAALESGAFTKTLRTQIQDTTKLINRLQAAGKAETAEYKEAVKHLADLKDQMADLNQMTSMLASDTKDLDVANKSLGALVSVMGTLQGITAMTGTENEHLNRVMKSLQVVMGGVATAISVANLAQKQFITTFKSSPWGWIATAVGLAAGAVMAYADKASAAANAEKERAKAAEEAAKAYNDTVSSGYKEVAILDSLIAKAKDTKLSYRQRAAAVKELNDKYPALKASLVGEAGQLSINTTAYENYRTSIINAAKAKAYDSKLTDSVKKQMEYEQQLLKKRQEIQAKQKQIDMYRSMAPNGDDPTGFISRYEAEKTVLENEAAEIKKNADIWDRETKRIAGIMTNLQTAVTMPDVEYHTPSSKPEAEYNPIEGSIDYLNKKLDEARKKLYAMGPDDPTRQETLKYIEELQKKIDELSGKVKDVVETASAPLPGSIDELQARLTEAQKNFNAATTDESRAEYKKQIEELRVAIDRLNGVVKETSTTIEESNISLMEQWFGKDIYSNIMSLTTAIQSLGSQLGQAFDSSEVSDFFDTMSKGVSILQTMVAVMEAINTLQETLGLIKKANAAATNAETAAVVAETAAETANASAKASSAVAGGVAAGSAIPFPYNLVAIAASIAAVVGALSMMGKYANGGIVGGATTIGDYNVIRANKGEMILNNREQARMWHMLNGQGINRGGLTQGNVTFRISGDELIGTLTNYENKRNRAL